MTSNYLILASLLTVMPFNVVSRRRPLVLLLVVAALLLTR